MAPVKFATQFVDLQHNKWSDHYLDYNGLKRILSEPEDKRDAGLSLDQSTKEVSLVNKTTLHDEYGTSAKFRLALERQIPIVSLFVMKQQGRLADELLQFRSLLSTMLAELSNNGPSSSTALTTNSTRTELLGKFHRMGAELLHLMQFVHLNRMALERILKKHDKRVTSPSLRAYESYILRQGLSVSTTEVRDIYSAMTAAPLFQTQSLDALCATLQSAYYDLMRVVVLSEEKTNGGESDMERGRGQQRQETSSRRARSPKGLGRNFQSIQGLDSLVQGVEDAQQGGSFQKLTQRHHSMYTSTVHRQEQDFVMAQIYAARRNLQQQSHPVTNMLADTALSFPPNPTDFLLLQQEGQQQKEDDKIKAEYERASALADYKQKSAISRTLNLVSSFIYMTNYLIVVPTVVTYSNKLGSNPAMSSAIVGMTPFATIFSTFLYSWWTSYSYKIPLLFATVLNVAGNIVYAMGYPCNSMMFVLVGRLMSGLGSCRPINRRYIADAYSTADRTAASAHFVAVGSFGMALGPFLGSVLHRIAENSSSPYWQVENAPGWFMAGVWFVYLIFHILFFVDPPKEEAEISVANDEKESGTKGEKRPLLETPKPASAETRIPIWKNSAVMVNFFIYFIEKLLMECVSSSTSILTYYYFDWPGSWAGYYLAFLCLLVLPVNLLVAYLSNTYEDRQMMVFMQVVTILGCLVILRYGPTYPLEQYLGGSLMIVVFSNMVEGPNMSLLSKVIPKSWRKGFLNVGLLATEAATLGRTVGDAYLALCGSGGLENQLNYTFGSMVLATVFTLWVTWRFYDSLVPTEDKTL